MKNKSKRPASKPAKSQAEPTRESLLAEIGARLDDVDAAWIAQRAGGKRPATSTVRLSSELGRLIDQLDFIVDEHEARDLITRELGAKPGEIPSWARPGTFLLWLDYVPIRCVWGGFAISTHCIIAADPDGLWVTGSGYRSLYEEIGVGAVDVRAYFRQTIERMTRDKKFKLLRLEEHAAAQCREILQEPDKAWLREALARGPVDPIPLPAHLAAVQQHLAL